MSRSLPPLSPESILSEALPDLFNLPAWREPATDADYDQALSYLQAMTGGRIEDRVLTLMAGALAAEGYTRAELYLACKKIPFDPQAAVAYNRPFQLSDFARQVQPIRDIHRKLRGRMSPRDVDEIIIHELNTAGVERGHLDIVGYDSRNEPVYRFNRDNTVRRLRGQLALSSPQPELEEARPVALLPEGRTGHDGFAAELKAIMDEERRRTQDFVHEHGLDRRGPDHEQRHRRAVARETEERRRDDGGTLDPSQPPT